MVWPAGDVMRSLTRRQVLGALAAVPAGMLAYEAPDVPEPVIQRHDEAVKRLLASQVTNAGSRGYGTLEDPLGVYAVRPAASFIEACTAAYLHPQSKFHRNTLLLDRMKLAAGYMERNQHADGFIDYRDTNFDSPPDTGFTIHNLATAACLAKRANRP